ncbi:MAG: GNAT family N-acetyltransferase [Actinomycetaceae bacterium]|nr:GNAT family N-acetyltransferase [Actinomycetaceae bacterium]
MAVWRTLNEKGVDALAQLIAACESYDNPPYRTSLAEIEELFSPQTRWQAIAAYDDAGEMMAYSYVHRTEQGAGRVVCGGAVHPRARELGLGTYAINWQLQAAKTLLPTSGTIVTHVDDGHDDLATVLDELGFEWTQTFYELRAKLEEEVPSPEPVPFVEIAAWNEELDEQIRTYVNNFTPDGQALSLAAWQLGRSAFAADASFVALDKNTDRSTIAGFVLCSRYEQDWDALGITEGYVDILVVDEKWRDTSLGKQLLTQVMGSFQTAGLEAVAAAVASNTDGGATSLYHELGFRTVGRTRTFTMQYAPPRANQ